MSRIYEALLRADIERKKASVSEDNQVDEPAVIPGIEEPPPTKSDVVLENIAQHPWKPSVVSLPTLADRGEGVEQFRSLRSRVYQARYEAPLKTILISSGMPSEGKSFVATNLAMSLARNSVNDILLIDSDLRRPTLHSLLGAPNTPGLSEYLAGTAELNDIMQRNSSPKTDESTIARSISNLIFIPAGNCSENSLEFAANRRIEKLVAALSPYFDWIVMDSPPVLAVTDAIDIASAADAVLLVARGDRTPFDVAQRAQAAFSNSRILGFVLNDVKDVPRSRSYYNYYYGGPNISDNAKHPKDKRSRR
jgi:capsular exopolysaccharide synthesis family protein